MATKSIEKNVVIKGNRKINTFLRAIEKSRDKGNKKGTHNPIRKMEKADLDKIFGDTR